MPIFVDPSTTAVYQTVPSASNYSGSGHNFVVGGHPQQPQPPTMAMMLVQNNPQQRHNDSSSNIPIPPGMEIVLGDKKYTIQYQSYEMTRKKAAEYVAKCTGTPYSRMSSPPDHEAISQPLSAVAGGSHAEGRGGLGGTPTTATITERFQRPRSPQAVVAPIGVAPEVMTATMTGDRGMIRTSSRSTATSEEEQQRQKSSDHVYTTMGSAATGLPLITRGALSQQQQQLLKVPEQQLVTTDSINYLARTYALPPPPPRDAEQQEPKNSGYFWEDGVWKAWHTNNSNDAAGAVGDAAAKMPPLPIQQNQYSQHPQQSYISQLQPEQSLYQHQYQYQYHYPHQQQQQQQPSIVTASTVHDPSSYAPSSYVLPHLQHRHHQPQPPQISGPSPLGLLPVQGNATSINASATTSTDSMLPRYI